MATVHKTAVIHPGAILEKDVDIGPYSVIGPDAQIGAGTKIGAYVVIQGKTILGRDNRVFTGSVIGSESQDLKAQDSQAAVEIGDENTIREYVTINRSSKGSGVTRIGNSTLIMTGAHIAHDCQIGDSVVMANMATLGGHCMVEDHAIVGGFTVAHQFVRIGRLCMVGGTSGLLQDAPPYMTVFGQAPARVVNVNFLGLKRHNIAKEVRAEIRKAFKILYYLSLPVKEATARIERDLIRFPEIEHLIEFLKTSTRGFCKGTKAEPTEDELDTEEMPHPEPNFPIPL